MAEPQLSVRSAGFAAPIFPVTEQAALAYAEFMDEAVRKGGSMSVQDGVIAAIALVNCGRLAGRNIKDFQPCGLDLISPWDF
ncbi:putative nucleic acid-binding protein [Rhizobium wenxiniae]|uniref:Putative nucleic acid-binding protein n=1 Tax=Rhizobium wenxiniae TaxID=1737357 RepID=A0A7W9YC54_9HYPH|nr:putative nucleic acid-binding protein [Rhizobium wenxiniae]